MITELAQDIKTYIKGTVLYNEPMSTGRRIAREIKMAIEKNKLKQVLD